MKFILVYRAVLFVYSAQGDVIGFSRCTIFALLTKYDKNSSLKGL